MASKKSLSKQTTKAKFRASKAWKDFRRKMFQIQKVDPITLKKLNKMAHLHHLDLCADNYKNLDVSRFVLLNQQTHDCIHFLFRYYEKDPLILRRVENILEMMKELSHDDILTIEENEEIEEC